MKSLETRIRFIIGINMCFRLGVPQSFSQNCFQTYSIGLIAGDKISCSKFVKNLTIPSIMTSALQGKFSVYGVNSKLN